MGEAYLDIIVRIEKAQADVKNLKDEMAKLGTKSEEVNKTVRKEFESTGRVANELKGMVAGLFTVGAITAFIKKMIDLRVEWTRQTAVIKTLTGSQKEAEASMKILDKVARASLTPLKEVSDAYIRLVHQGIKPSYSEMKKMADVAVASGKSFGQLAEAIFDATNGQTRGLRDFGIQLKMMGDKVQLSFRGVSKTVDLTGASISDFVIKMGEMNGIAGATDAVTKTLGGSINLLGEEFDDLVRTLGKFSERNIIESVGILTNLLSIVNSTIELTSSDKAEKSNKFYKNIAMHIASLIPIIGDVVKSKQGMDLLSKFLDMTADKMRELSKVLDMSDLLPDPDKLKGWSDLIHDLVTEMQKGIPDISISEIMGLGTMDEVTSFQKRFASLIGTLSGDELDEATVKVYWLGVRLKELAEKGLKELMPDIEIDKIKSITDAIIGLADIPDSELAGYGEDLKAAYNKLADKIQATREEDLLKFKFTEEEKITIAQETLQTSLGYIDLLYARNADAMNKELALAGDNEKKKDEIRRKYAKKAQNIAIGEAIIQGAQAFLNALGTKPFPLGLVLAALSAILTGLQISKIKSQKFAKGVQNLQGRGTGTSDEIPAMLSRGETVMTAEEENKYHPYLKAMKEGKFPKLQLELMKDFSKLQGVTNNNLNYDNSKEIRELREIRKALLREQQSEHIEGKYRVVRRGNITTKISLN